MPKIHKPGPKGSKTRPVCSNCASLLHPIGQWLNEFLQPIAQSQAFHFPDSYHLKQELEELEVTPWTSLVTFDAVEMYPSIPSDECLQRLDQWFCRPEQAHWFAHVPIDCVMEALTLVLRNNTMRLGDVLAKMIRGISMGIAPAPPIADIFMGTFEEDNVVAKFDECAPFIRRFIDNGLAKWERHPDPNINQANWIQFKTTMNASGLKRIFTEPSQSVVSIHGHDNYHRKR